MVTLKHEVGSAEITIPPHAECYDCGWSMRGSITTQAQCKAHVAATGHTVCRSKETVTKYYAID